MRTVIAWYRMLKSAGLSRMTVSAVLHTAGAAPSIDRVATSVGARLTAGLVLDVVALAGGGVSTGDGECAGDGMGAADGLSAGDAKMLPVDSAPTAGGTVEGVGARTTEPLVMGTVDTGGGTAAVMTTGVATTGIV